MYRGGAILYSIGVCLLISLLSGSILFLSFLYSTEIFQLNSIKNVILNSKSGLNLLLVSNFSEYKDKSKIDLFGKGVDSVELQLRTWGIYRIASSFAWSGKFNATKIALLGKRLDADDHTAMILSNSRTPLSLCGNTELTGNFYIPGGMITKTYLEGQSFSSKGIVKGKFFKSEGPIPNPSNEFVAEMIEFVRTKGGFGDSVLEWESIEENRPIANSFNSKTLILKSKYEIRISSSIKIEGNIIIESDTKIIVDGNAAIEDAILISPQIILESGFTGTLQCFTTDSIHVYENCLLNYPSALVYISEKQVSKNPCIKVEGGTSIYGEIISYCNSNEIKTTNHTSIGIKSKINGIVYTSGSLDIKGVVNGVVYANQLIYNDGASSHLNTLMNAIINRDKLPKTFVCSFGALTDTYGIAKYIQHE